MSNNEIPLIYRVTEWISHTGQFEVLIAAADAESFSAAAQRLGISQPSLSELIRRIEREIGALLFERTTRSVKLTPEGRHAAAVAREIVRDFKRALERLASRSNDRHGRISIAALPSIACAVLPAVIEVFRCEHPGIDVALHDIQHERALAMVIEGTVDTAVTSNLLHTTIWRSQRSALMSRIWCAEAMTRWRDRHPCDGAICADGLSSGSPRFRRFDASPTRPSCRLKSPSNRATRLSNSTAIALVEAGLGVTALPSLTFSMFKGRKLAMRPLVQPRLRRNVGFVTFAGRTMPDFTDALLQAIRHGLLQELQIQSHQA